MTAPFDLLGIAADADERTIKLAYAKLLKLTRPDDDPEGFQRLNQAYQRALKIARSRGAAVALRRGQASSRPMIATLNLSANAPPTATPRVTQTGEPAPAAPSRPPPILVQPAPEPAAPRPQRPVFDAQAFLAEYRSVSAAGGANALSRWLMDYPAFWHLPTKHAAGQWLLRILFESPEAMPEGCFTATSEFFHYEDAISGVDPLALRRVGARINAASLVKPEQARDLALHAFRNSQWSSRKSCIRAVRRLSRPFRWWRDLAHALWMPAVRRVAAVANALCNGNPDDLPPPIDRAHARFWMDACSPAKPRVRLLLAALRCAVALVFLPLAWAALVWFFQHEADAPDAWQSAFTAWQVVAVSVGTIVALFWVPIGTRVLFNEADALAARSVAFRLLMAGFTPAMCALAMFVARSMDATLGTLIAIASMFIAIWRMRVVHRHRALTQFDRIARVVAFFAYVTVISVLANASGMGIDPALLPTFAIVLPALAFWAYDWFKRGFLHPRTPRATRNLRPSRPV
ncbi:MAG TPA: J domain-containing protein [Rhodanobacteraceae bacterium]|nr:J domain-containing protein [Rhodanobacteraceae bacterium]